MKNNFLVKSFFTLLLICSCSLDLDLLRSSAVDNVPGGECAQPVVAEIGAHPNINGVITNSEIVVSRTGVGDPGGGVTEDFFGDLSKLITLPPSGKRNYIELTVKSSTKDAGNVGTGPRVAVGVATLLNHPMLGPVPGSSVAMHIYPADGIVEFSISGAASFGTINGAITLPYTVGYSIDSAGDVYYQDSMGRSGLIGTHADFQNPGEQLGVGAAFTAPVVGEAATIELNLGERNFILTPPVGSMDFCGNAL